MKKEKEDGEEEAGVELKVNEEEEWEVDREDTDLRKVLVAAVGANQGTTEEMREITKVNPKNMITKELLKRSAMTVNTMVNINLAQEVANLKKSTEQDMKEVINPCQDIHERKLMAKRHQRKTRGPQQAKMTRGSEKSIQLVKITAKV